ncbi:putative ubiquitin-binding protein [Operophtera brumata]|uniref:Putative ubiquitin-binding protein n=1 Tax=Operophtera brumata TaxID=104452 RepID=A0A0L7LJU0_OPEBR|nr:putative ubiquitin-binding protein [Operophtera brumata]
MECLASEKGDSPENLDPSKVLNGSKTAAEVKAPALVEGENVHMEAPAESGACCSEPAEDVAICEIPEQIEFTVVFNKARHDITFAYDATVLELKAHLERICGVSQSAQKLLIRGMAKDEMTLRKAGIVKGGKVMLVGSKMDDILAILESEKAGSTASKEPLCMQKLHKKVLDKGIPPDAMPGIKGVKGLQLGPTEASRYWVYWVPAQYIEAIKDAVLGVWQFF